MTRVAWTAALRPNRVDEYVRAHADVWPEVLSAIREAGIRNYSIFLFGDRVFATYECDDPEDSQAREGADAATQVWRSAMARLFDGEVAERGVTFLPEIFHLD